MATYYGTDLITLWKEGAQQLDTSAIGKVITAPIELPAEAITAAEGTLEEVPTAVTGVASGVASTAKILPIVLVILAGGAALYLFNVGKKGTKLTPF